MEHSEFLGLNLPQDTDPVDVSALSENFSALDGHLSGGAGIPAGGIIIWSGAADAVPVGWKLCDGSNGTPDLRDRFVLGGGGSKSVGATGGSETVTLTTSQMPSHTHNVPFPGTSDSYDFLESVKPVNSGHTSSSTMGRRNLYSKTAGGNATNNNMPPYYVLCYIMKI